MKKAQKHSFRRLFITGFTMGTADTVPGVSGGTVAFIAGVYDELLLSIRRVTGDALRNLLRGQFRSAWKTIPFRFLVPLGSGLLIAVFTLASLITYLLETYPVYIAAFFIGLVVASIHVVKNRVHSWRWQQYASLVVATVATIGIVTLAPITGSGDPISLVVSGAIGFTAMILPGISGSLLLLILGQYERVINAVADRDFVTLGLVALGGIIGLALFARVLMWLLEKYHDVTVAALIGMMIGSLVKLWPWQITDEISSSYYLPDINISLLIAFIFTLIAFACVVALEKAGAVREHHEDL